MAAADSESSENTVTEATKKLSLIQPVNGLTEKVVGDLFDEWERVGTSSFTHGFLVQSLRKNDAEFVQKHGHLPIKQVKTVNISKNKGFASIVYKATFHFVDSPFTYSTVLKVPGSTFEIEGIDTSPHDDPQKLKFAKLHDSECYFYRTIAKSLDLPIPRVLSTSSWVIGEKEGFIHMEDMTVKSVTTYMFDPLSVSQVFNVLRLLAGIHKKTLSTTDWRGKYPINIGVYTDISSMIAGTMEPILGYCSQDGILKNLIQKYSKFSVNLDFIRYAFCDSWKELKLDPVLVHGDLWGGNIMWLSDEFRQPSSKVGAFLDWQLMHEGSIMADVARVITMCTDGDTRRFLETTMLQFYLEELTRLFEEEGQTCPVGLDQLKKAYQIMFLSQAVVLPLLAMFTSSLKDKDSDENLDKARAEKLILRTRHVFEDLDKLATGELKWIFDKYNN